MPGITPIGYRRDGSPIWPIMGGDGTAPGGAAPQAGGAPAPQAGAPAGGQEPPSGSGQAPSGDPPAAGSGDGESLEARANRLERELRETRNEAATNRRRAQELERTATAAAQAGMTELEREQARATAAEQRAQALEAQVQAQALETATVSVATRLGFRNPELAYRLVDRSAVDYNKDGRPTNVEALLAELAKSDPYLLKSAGGDYGGGDRGKPPEGGKPSMNELIRTAMGRG
jgi:type II secretory pathway pseudopilin PulG